MNFLTKMNMLCPCCRTPLEEGEMERLETLDEHVCNPNREVSLKMSYRCSDASCPTREADIIWNEDGERYGGFSFDRKKFIGQNDGPFGTWSRKANVEISKHGVRERHELFTIGSIRFEREFEYKSDYNGNVLGTSWHIRKWKRDGDGVGWFSYEFPIISFFSSVKNGIERGRRLKKKKSKMNGIDNLSFQVFPNEKRWWRIWAVKVNRFLFPSLVVDIPFKKNERQADLRTMRATLQAR